MARSGFAFLFSLFVGFAAWAGTEPDKTLPYKKLDELYERVAAAAKYKHLRVYVRIVPANPARKPQELIFTIESKSGPIVVPCDAKGNLAWPSTPALRDENPTVRVNIPESEKLRSVLSIDAVVADLTHFSTAELNAGVTELEGLIGEQAGMLSWLAPSVQAAVIRCKGCSAKLTQAGAADSLLNADAAGEIALPVADDWATHPKNIALSKAADEITFRVK